MNAMNPDGESHSFAPTRWTLIQRAASADEGIARRALAEICEIYRAPVLGLVLHYVRHPQDAEDLTHGFFLKLIEANFFAKAEQPRGRLRNLLWTSARRYIDDWRDAGKALKRGGGAAPASLEALRERHSSAHDPADDMTPDRLWQRDWALALLADVSRRLEAEHATDGKAGEFALLRSRLPHSTEPRKSREEIAAALGIAAGEVSTRAHRLGVKFNEYLIAAVKETLDDPTPENVRHEIGELLHYFRGEPPVYEKNPRRGKSPPADSVEER